MRVAFFGTPDFAVPTLSALVHSDHEVVCVVSQPDRPRGRGRKVYPSPVSALAHEAGLPLLRPEKVGDPAVREELEAFRPDIGVVVAFGQFLTRWVRELPACGYLINAHASLLPDYRGAAPIAHALLDGRTETGISVMRVEKEMDAGAVALVRTLRIGPDENCGELTARLGDLAATAILEALGAIADDRIEWQEQDHAKATLAPKIARDDARIDWSQPARALRCRVRAMAPSPGARTTWNGDPLLILAAQCEEGSADEPAGRVGVTDGGIRIATGDGWLVPTRLQRAGGKPLATADFLRGRPIPDGTILGS